MTTQAVARSGFQRMLLPLLAVGSLIASVTLGGLAAHAAPPYDTNGTLSDIRFTQTTVQDGQLAELSAKWSFPDNPTGKVGFTIALPAPLAGQGDTFPITAEDTGSTMATCVTTLAELQCDFDPAYVAENPVGLRGDVFFWVRVEDRVTSEQERIYVVGESSVTVVVKPRPVCTSNCQLDFKYGKQGIYDNSKHSILWYADVKGGATGMAGGEEVVIRDIVSANQTMVPTGTSLQYTNTTAINPGSGLELPSNWANVPNDKRAISADGTTISFTAEAGYFYRAVYRTSANDFGASGTYLNGVQFTVNGVVDGSATGSARYAGGGGSGIGTDVGVVTITKQVDGTAVGLDPAQTFTGTYTVVPPTGATLSGSWSVVAGGTWRSPEFPRDSTVTLTEDAPPQPSNVTWTSAFSTNGFTLPGGRITPVTVTNTADVKLSNFTLAKRISGEADELVPADATFTVDYAYPAGVGFAAGSGSITLAADGTAVTSADLPVGAVVTLTERAPLAVTGGAWQAPVFSQNPLEVTESQTIAVTVENPIVHTLGGFALKKTVSGGADHLVPAGTTFTVDYTWVAPDDTSGSGSIEVIAGGDAVTVAGIPRDSVVTLVERNPDAIEGVSWLDPIYSTNGFTILAGTTIEIDLDNPTTLRQGAFSVQKQIEGSGAALVTPNTAFTVDYAYPAGEGFAAGSGSLVVLADGTSTLSNPLPYGAVVTLTEAAPADVTNGRWVSAKFSSTELTIGDGTVVAIVLTNTIDDITPPLTRPLANTGAPIAGGLLGVAGAILVVGALLTVAVRRARSTQ